MWSPVASSFPSPVLPRPGDTVAMPRSSHDVMGRVYANGASRGMPRKGYGAWTARRTGRSRIMISNVSAERAHDWRRTAMNTVATATRTLPASSQRIAPEKFAHVVLKTANYDAVITWYATVLQARVAFRNDVIAFLTYDDEHHRVAVINTPGSPASDPAAAGVHHIAYTYAGLGELLATYRRLKPSGVEPARCTNH